MIDRWMLTIFKHLKDIFSLTGMKILIWIEDLGEGESEVSNVYFRYAPNA